MLAAVHFLGKDYCFCIYRNYLLGNSVRMLSILWCHQFFKYRTSIIPIFGIMEPCLRGIRVQKDSFGIFFLGRKSIRHAKVQNAAVKQHHIAQVQTWSDQIGIDGMISNTTTTGTMLCCEFQIVRAMDKGRTAHAFVEWSSSRKNVNVVGWKIGNVFK